MYNADYSLVSDENIQEVKSLLGSAPHNPLKKKLNNNSHPWFQQQGSFVFLFCHIKCSS